MKIYISADIEGISGVVKGSQTTETGHDYERARRLMTEEVNAVIRGAKAAGACDILVNDSHGPMTNIIIEDLDEDARLISGNKKLYGMMEGLDESFDAVMLIGYHARHNTPGVLSHTYYGIVISEVKINGKVFGESEFNSLLAGHFGVPVVMVSGDNVLSDQVNAFNEKIETVVVKKAHSRYTAECVQPKKVHKMLEEATKKVLSSNYKDIIEPCKIKGPVELEMTFLNSGMAEATLFIPGVELIEANKIRYKAKDIVEAYKMRAGLTTLAASTLK
ncbi:M55 family metallopeptidase [Haloimpatiens massiliensis]|uniref:M55 family metallopeptidase n=1 Tax=Haloimpatiens massiliensis TaxID=1658110 RepID=UPI000C862AE3|nr:M55 family metallopeptidase [Haloimpatiens massiliensis]